MPCRFIVGICGEYAEALQELAQDLATGTSADKERSVSMLSSLTLYVDHHDAILRTPGVLECLMDAVIDERLVPQVQSLREKRDGISVR